MKTRITKEKYDISELRPNIEYNKYIDLINKDVVRIFNNNAGMYINKCPACNSTSSIFKFSKHGFVYRECQECLTIFMTPRPTIKMLHEFYANSEGIKYWTSNQIQNTKYRNEHIFKNRIRWINESLEIEKNSSKAYLDYYPKFPPFIEEISKLKVFEKFVAYKPFESILEIINNTKFEVRNTIENEKFSVISAFEVIDRFFNPKETIKTIYNLLEFNGLLFLSTTSASGLDIQFLLKKARNIVPPINMTIFSIEGIVKMLNEEGFEILELSTPGTLDVQILENQIDEINLPKFLIDIIKKRDNSVKEIFQEFLQRACLSSHMNILAQKKENNV